MNSIFRKLIFCALLGASTTAHAAFVPFPNGDFASAPSRGSWGQAGPVTFSYPEIGGNPGGYGVMSSNNGQWGVWVSNDNGPALPLPPGLLPGYGYNFKMDMKLESGSAIGGLKLEWQGAGDTGDIRLPSLGAGWNTYTFPVIIPTGATGYKVVPLWGNNSTVGYDNIGYESVPYFVPPPPPSDVIVLNRFNMASPNWTAPVIAGAGITGSSTWSNTEGNPPGSTILAATNPQVVGGNASISYVATGVNFGTGPVEISFDGRLLSALPGTAIHVRYNGNFVGAIQGSLNPTTFSTFTRTFNLSQGFTGTTTFTLTFEFAMGAVPASGGSIAVDNIIVKTNLPPPPVPFAAAIKTGKAVSWLPPAPFDAYQPQRSSNGTVFTDLGPLVLGSTQTSIFDSPGSPFYRVIQSTPFVQDIIFNGAFTDEEPEIPQDADGWTPTGTQFPTRLLTGGRSGPCMQLKVLNAADESNTSILLQNTTNAYNVATGDPLPGTVTPGRSYKLEFWAKQISAGVSYEQSYSLRFLSVGGGILASVNDVFFNSTVGGDWTKYSTTLLAPPDAVSAFIEFSARTGAVTNGQGEVLIDDFSLTATGYNTLPTPLAATAIDAVEVSWPSALGKNYQVQSSGDLASWANFGGVVSGDGSILAVYNAMVGPKQFYRVIRTNQ